VQQNVVRENGRRSVLISIIKNGNASTVEVVKRVKEALKVARKSAPSGLEIKELFDQSVFVTNLVTGVIREGAIAAALTALMILLFLGSWRSTLIVMISIPLAILSSLVVLYFLGDTLNTMMLGGLALAVGIRSALRFGPCGRLQHVQCSTAFNEPSDASTVSNRRASILERCDSRGSIN
jgi:multidrug efflux pump subunit AcrB